MKTYIPLCVLCLAGCSALGSSPVSDANKALVAAQGVAAAVCAEPVPAEMVEPCKVLKDSLVKAQDAAKALEDAGVK